MSSLPRSSGIYMITCLANHRIYIGSTVNIANRWQQHCGSFKRGDHQNQHLQRAWQKYGAENFHIEVIELVDRTMLIEREQYYLDLLKPFYPKGFNIAMSARMPGLGRVPSDETRAKIGAAHKGRKHTPEARAKLSAAHMGRKLPRTQVEKMIASNTGKKRTAEFGERLGERNRELGQTPSARQKIAISKSKSYIVTSPDGIETHIFNLSEFCRQHNLHNGHMASLACGVGNYHKGWKCRHA